jgi:uncharacterized protein (DUF2384 family)
MKTATVEKHAVGGKSTHPTELIQKIQKGLRFSELKTLQDTLDLPFEKLAAKLCISRSTLQRRKAAGRLSPDAIRDLFDKLQTSSVISKRPELG